MLSHVRPSASARCEAKMHSAPFYIVGFFSRTITPVPSCARVAETGNSAERRKTGPLPTNLPVKIPSVPACSNIFLSFSLSPFSSSSSVSCDCTSAVRPEKRRLPPVLLLIVFRILYSLLLNSKRASERVRRFVSFPVPATAGTQFSTWEFGSFLDRESSRARCRFFQAMLSDF